MAGVLVAALGGTTTAVLAAAPDTDAVAMADPSANIEDAALREAGKKSGRPVLVSALTSETTEVYARPDGKFEAHLAAAPVRTLRDGQWVPIDLKLKASNDGTVAPGALPATCGDHDLMG